MKKNKVLSDILLIVFAVMLLVGVLTESIVVLILSAVPLIAGVAFFISWKYDE